MIIIYWKWLVEIGKCLLNSVSRRMLWSLMQLEIAILNIFTIDEATNTTTITYFSVLKMSDTFDRSLPLLFEV